jgi:hypothetical protein
MTWSFQWLPPNLQPSLQPSKEPNKEPSKEFSLQPSKEPNKETELIVMQLSVRQLLRLQVSRSRERWPRTGDDRPKPKGGGKKTSELSAN